MTFCFGGANFLPRRNTQTLFDHCRIIVTFPVNKWRPAAFGFKTTVGGDRGDRSVNHFAAIVKVEWVSFADR
jgi:hypothetical protein